ncbi:metabotropic glycine receptor [Clarias gariepinus]
MSLPDKLLILLLLSSLLSAQLSHSFNFRTSSVQEPTPSASNICSTVEEELAASTQPPNVSTDPQVEVEEEDWFVPENYLYSGNASLLSSSRCHNSFQLSAQHGAIPQDIKDLLNQPTVSLTNAVNFLNLIFQASELRETSVREDIDWYHALIRSMVVGERSRLVRRALLSFDADPSAPQPQLILWASKSSSQDIYLQDLTLAWEKLHLLPHGLNQSWFNLLKSNSLSSTLSKQILLNDLSTLDTPKWAHGGTFVTNSSGLQWGEGPFLECKEGHFQPGWLLTISLPFYGLKPDLSPEFRGVIRVDVDIQDVDVNQCAIGDFWFADTHQCNRTSMECEPIPSQGFRLGQYCCRCKEGYYSLPTDTDDQLDEVSSSTQGCYPVIPLCVPCWPGCKQCQDGSPCWVQEDWNLRAALLTLHSFFMALVIIIMLRVYQCRRTRPIRASGFLLLEIILLGSLLLYFPVLIIFFKPSTFHCILLRWVRLLGFVIVYGTMTLKMYRVLNVFLSCTAQRVPYMSNASVLRMLGVMVLTVKWFLCAWTMGVLQNQDRNIPLLITLTTSDGQSFKVCDWDRWDYMMVMAELMFLCWGISLSSAVKNVPSAFHEPRYMGIAIHNELLFSTMFHLLRFIKQSLQPDWMLLLFFIHIHVTITVTLGLLCFPKFLHISRLIKEDIASEIYEDEVDLRRSCLHLNNSFTSGCWSDHNLDPDDIRGELKKLYAQLEVHKTKKMENNNPHLQKKRSSRLMLGRSLIRRLAEIPEGRTRQDSRKDKDASGDGGGSCLANSGSTRVIMRNETAKVPSAETEKCVSVKDVSLRNSPVKNCMNKRASETESIDTAPLFCKSVSAQNLAVDNNFLQPVSTRVQKSFSFPEKHRDHFSLSPTNSMLDTSHVLKTKFDKAEVKQEESRDTNQKHAICTRVEQETLKQKCKSSTALLYVCPWEFASSLPSSSPPTVKDVDSDVESSSPKPPISSSAPGSPYSLNKPKARSTTDGVTEKRKEDTSAHTAQGAKANRPLMRCDALCPWEMKGGSQASVTEPDNNSDIFSWEEPIGEEESDAETAAEAFIFPPDL